MRWCETAAISQFVGISRVGACWSVLAAKLHGASRCDVVHAPDVQRPRSVRHRSVVGSRRVDVARARISKSYLFSAYVPLFHTIHILSNLLGYIPYEFSVPVTPLELHATAAERTCLLFSKSYLFPVYVSLFHTVHIISNLLSYNPYEFSPAVHTACTFR